VSETRLVLYRCPTPTNVLCPCGAVARKLGGLALAFCGLLAVFFDGIVAGKDATLTGDLLRNLTEGIGDRGQRLQMGCTLAALDHGKEGDTDPGALAQFLLRHPRA